MPEKSIKKVKVAGGSKLWVRPEFAVIPSCPGCQEPMVGQIILEVLEEMELDGECIAVPGVGCSSFLPMMWNVDVIMTGHGRPCDVATAIKRVTKLPLVFTLQGDGDCFAIGAGATVSAALRGEKITVVTVNNTTYGTTGGQMSPTTVSGQRTTTSPLGRGEEQGYPAHVPELLGGIKGVAYTARGAVNTPANYQKTKRYIKTAFQKQLDGVGFSLVEVIVACPPNWHYTPVECLRFIDETLLAEFALGEFKNVDRIEQPIPVPAQ